MYEDLRTTPVKYHNFFTMIYLPLVILGTFNSYGTTSRNLYEMGASEHILNRALIACIILVATIIISIVGLRGWKKYGFITFYILSAITVFFGLPLIFKAFSSSATPSEIGTSIGTSICLSLFISADIYYWNRRKLFGYGISIGKSSYNITSIQTIGKSKMNTSVSNAENTIRFCRKCGNRLIEGSRFCNACGQKVWEEHITTKNTIPAPPKQVEQKSFYFENAEEFTTYIRVVKPSFNVTWIDSSQYAEMFNKGYIAVEQQDFKKAIHYFNQAIKVNPVAIKARFELINCYNALKNGCKVVYELKKLERFLLRNTDVARYYRAYGYYLVEQNDYPGAVACYSYSLQFEDNLIAHQELEFLKQYSVTDIDLKVLIRLLSERNIRAFEVEGL